MTRIVNISDLIVETLASLPEELRDICDYDHGYINSIFDEIADENMPNFSQLIGIVLNDIGVFENMARRIETPFDFFYTAQCVAREKQFGEYNNYRLEVQNLIFLNYIHTVGIKRFDKADIENVLDDLGYCDRIEEIIDHANELLKNEALKRNGDYYYLDYGEG